MRRVVDHTRQWFCVIAIVLVGTACQQDPLTFVWGPDAGPDAAPAPDLCVPSEAGTEVCDGKDNNCNGQVDEDFNTQTDPQNCGTCGNSCSVTGALTTCELGRCKFVGCAPGFVDLNADQADGCEHACTSSGAEVCDGADNDCNGQVDETFDLNTDTENCGACGKVCQLANAVVKCEQGVCKVQQCNGGFIDVDDQVPGCETPCSLTHGGTEICDGVDNDCNGVIDDPGGTVIDLNSDALNCGGCGVVCAIPNATVACQSGSCVFTGCQPPFVNTDQNTSNGCECQPTGVEVCDGKDNDCDGNVDTNIPGLPGLCGTATGACIAGVLNCVNGVEVCSGAVGPEPNTATTAIVTATDSSTRPSVVLARRGASNASTTWVTINSAPTTRRSSPWPVRGRVF